MITRLLLIDSDISFIVTLKGALESTGQFRVNLAANGQAAHEALLHSAYHAALVDFEPVDMDPLELVRMIRQVRPDLPVIMMPRDEAEMARAQAMDVQGAIPKPFTARELIAYLGEVIGRVEGPVITPPEGEIADEFAPPAMPVMGQSALSELPADDEMSPARPPTRLFSPEERDFIQQGLHDLDEPDAVPPAEASTAMPAPPDMSELLAEFEVFDRLQTGRLGRIQEDAGEWETIPPLTLPPAEPEAPAPAAAQDEEVPPLEWSGELPTTWLLDETDAGQGATRLLDEDEELPSTLLLDESGSPAEQGAPPLEWSGELPTTWLLDETDAGQGATRLLDEDEELPSTLLLDESGSPAEQGAPPLEWSGELPTTWLLDEEEAEGGTTRLLDREEEGGATLLFDDWQAAEPPPTRALDEEQEPEPTRRLPDTGTFEKLLGAAGWDETERPLVEPPVQHDDTPTVPPHDLEGVRQFLATHVGEPDAAEFGDVLDAVAQTPPEHYERSPDDRAFHDLVESLRDPDMNLQRRTRLEELLASIAADSGQLDLDAEGGSAIDYVLDAIRRAGPAAPTDETTPEDTTIGEVIGGLFEPSFEGVLAALAGEEVDETEYDEPSYSRPAGARVEPDPADLVAPEDMAAEESPSWLAEAEPEPFEAPVEPSPEPEAFVEPPLTEEDSRHYPATAALAAVSSAEAGDDFSLSQLLAEIEEQLPPVLPRQPRLKPLPSWGKGTRLADARDLEAIFDRLQSEALRGAEDTQPSAHPSAAEMTGAGPDLDLGALFQEMDTQPAGVPDELRELADAAPADEADITALFYAGVRAEAAPDAWQFAPADEETVAPPLAGPAPELTWEEPAESGPETGAAPAEPVAGVELWPLPEEPAAPEQMPVAARAEAEGEEAAPASAWEAEQPPVPVVPPEEEGLIAVPVEEAARLLGGETIAAEAADEIDIAQMAVNLTQYSLESSAQATLLSRPGRLLAHAGELPAPVMQRLFEIVDAAWRTASAPSDALTRYITLPEAGEFLLYSMVVEGNMVLSMVFGANTSLRTIRRQARRLGESLNLVPEAPEPPAARTRPRRPSPPPVPPAVTEAEPEVAESVAVAAPEPEAPAPPPPAPTVGYTCLWIPHDPRLELRGEFAQELAGWLEEFAQQEGWAVEALAIHNDYVQMTLAVPQNLQPDQVMTRLMTATAERSAAEFPDLAFGQPLWADGYFFVTPPRELSDREIARFITFQRQS
jgi:CheY-like chemotaxis protein/REP element-mobilizing transposase RayT